MNLGHPGSLPLSNEPNRPRVAVVTRIHRCRVFMSDHHRRQVAMKPSGLDRASRTTSLPGHRFDIHQATGFFTTRGKHDIRIDAILVRRPIRRPPAPPNRTNPRSTSRPAVNSRGPKIGGIDNEAMTDPPPFVPPLPYTLGPRGPVRIRNGDGHDVHGCGLHARLTRTPRARRTWPTASGDPS